MCPGPCFSNFIFLDGTILLSGTVNAKSLFLSGYMQEEGEGAVGCGYRLTSAPGCTEVHVMKQFGVEEEDLSHILGMLSFRGLWENPVAVGYLRLELWEDRCVV